MQQPETPASITFIATSNNVTATENQRDKVPLRQVISNSEAFHKAFEQKNTTGHTSRSGLRADPKAPQLANSPEIIQSSSDECSSAGNLVHAARYGLVSAIMDAYNTHHCLVLRPDDIWQAILTQFSIYVNANAEDLRNAFVDFQGKRTLVIEMQGSLFAADFAATFANRMVDEQIAPHLKDPEVTAWLLPNFSTTQPTDRVVASVTIMSTLQAYFDYVCCLMCGIPEVTLEGTVDDWRLLRQKIDRLPQYDITGNDPVMAQWHALLVPVLDEFVTSATGHPDLAFWDRVCSHSGGGSGPSYLSGWVTVFACFKATGQWMGDVVPGGLNEKPKQWPCIDTDNLPVGVVSVPVLVDDNGTQYDTQMVAGQFAYEMVTLGQKSAKLDTVRPRNDWCLAYDEGKQSKIEPRAYKSGEIRSVGT
mmetsp:Transcript_8324/g.8157  ORF Transcript_8324/g.8157 Transcript_8324/m.8157 type:complete len:420 (+) Transcript_8324:43-1302(+)